VSGWNRMSALLGSPTDRFRGLSTSLTHHSSILTLHTLT
jgi:hypothetical protein